MRKIIKWIIGVLGILIVLIVIVSLCLPLFIDPNDYKDTIARAVQEKTGRSLAIPGDIDLDVSLIGLKTVFKLGEVRLSSSPDFPGTEFFTSKHVEINLALWPLLKDRELQVNKVSLDGVGINLVKNEKGVGSWEDLVGGGEQKAPEKKAEAEKEPGGGLSAIDIGSIQARDINFTYTDKTVGRTIRLNNLDLETGRIRPGHSFPIKAAFKLLVAEGEREKVSGAVNMKSDIAFYPVEQHFVVEGFSLDGVVKDKSLAPNEIDFGASADIDLALQQQNITIKNMTVRQGKMQLDLMLTVTGFSNPQLKGSVRIPRFSPRNQAEFFGLELPTEDPKSLANMSAQLDFSGSLAAIDFSSIVLNIDDTTATGKASVTDLLNPAYDLNLHIDQLDLDRYSMKKENVTPDETPPPSSSSSAPTSGEKTAAEPALKEEAPALPAEQLRKLTFNAEVNLDRLKAAKMNMSKIRLKTNGKGGLVQLNPLAADFYDGTITITGDIDARADTPKIHLKNNLQGVQLGPLFADLTGREEIKGRANILAEVTSSGNSNRQLKENTNGTMSISVADGEIAKLKIIDTIRTAKSLLGSKKKEEQKTAAEEQPSQQMAESGRSTTFASLKGTGIITNGVFRNDDLLAESELMKVQGKGTVDFVHEQIDYLLTIYLAKSIDRNEKTGLVDLADTPIPYRVKGTFDKISQSAALEEIVKSEAKKLLFKELDKQLGGQEKTEGANKEKSGSPTDLINKGLKSIFGK